MKTTGRMPPLVAAFLFLTGAIVVLATVATYDAGALKVSVKKKKPGGQNIRLIVPAVLVTAALNLVPAEKLQEEAEEIKPWLPAIRSASQQLARSPDAVLVEVIGSDEQVSIAQRGGALIVDVDSSQESVHVTVPLKLLDSLARKLQASAPPG